MEIARHKAVPYEDGPMHGREGVTHVRWAIGAAMLVAVLATLALAGLASGQSGVSDVVYTSDADFDKGTAVNLNHGFPNELQLNDETSTFPFIWVSLSVRCTIAKINTETGAILGEYRTISDDADCNQSSRTTVALDGSVWVGHRGPGGVTHVGNVGSNQCVDRNGNGSIETSSGYGDVKPWPGSDSDPANVQDECILHHVNTDAVFGCHQSESLGLSGPLCNGGDSRHMSIDANNNLWVGNYNSGQGGEFIRVNGSTGAIETPVKHNPCGGYGGLIDGNGIIWSAQGPLLRWDPNAPDSEGNPSCIQTGHSVYGVAVDANGFIWTTSLSGSSVKKTSPDGTTHAGPFDHGYPNAQGLAAAPNGDVWVGSSLFCGSGCPVGHLKNDGTFVGNVPNPTGSGSTGVAVDAAGKIWTANLNSNSATRIDPDAGPLGCGGTGCADGSTHVGAVDLTVNFPEGPDGRPLPSPYNYSDMTGQQLLSATAPQGTWTVVQDGGAAGTKWGKIVWNTEARGSQPPGTDIIIEVRAADTQAGLGSQPFVAVANGAEFSLTGRFLEVRVTLRPDANGNGPILSDVRICAQGGCQAESAQPPTTERPTAQRRPRARVTGVPSRRCTRANFSTRVRVTAAAGVRSVRVMLDGRRIASTRRAAFNLRVPARALRSGRHRLTVVVRDRNGRQARVSRVFQRCPRPPRPAPVPHFTG
jgi:hypothetical protein